MLGTSEVWQTIATGVTTAVGGWIAPFTPIIVVFVGIAAFGLVLYLVIGAISKKFGG